MLSTCIILSRGNYFLLLVEPIFFNSEAILLSILITFLKYFSTSLCKLLTNLKLFKSETAEYKRLNAELKDLKNELRSIDQVGNFVEYALTQRKMNKVQEMLNKEIDAFRKRSLKTTMYIKFAYKALIIILSVYLILNNKNKPIIDFTSLIERNNQNMTIATIFYPFDFLFSFPNFSLTNSIGVTVWLFILSRSMDILLNKIKCFIKPPKVVVEPQQPPMKLNDDIELD